MTTAFAIPVIWSLQICVLAKVHQLLDWGRDFQGFEPIHLLFMSLLGSIVTVWSLLRIINPESRFGLYDSAARLLFSIHMVLAVLSSGTRNIWLYFAPEITGGIVQLVVYFM
jgi:hypothetical protein